MRDLWARAKRRRKLGKARQQEAVICRESTRSLGIVTTIITRVVTKTEVRGEERLRQLVEPETTTTRLRKYS